MKEKLCILLSAYACEPGKGSEPGMGWHWAIEIARLGHEVHILTRENNLGAIRSELARHPDLRVYAVGYDLPRWMRFWKKGGRGAALYYSLWQRGACQFARRLAVDISFDLVHHITFAVFRQPSFMGRLGIPFILGPLGGGEATPSRLLRTYPYRGRASDSARSALNRLARINPAVRQAFGEAGLILFKTRETLAYVPSFYLAKCLRVQDVGTEEALILREPCESPQTPRFLFVGRLLYWKGVHLALEALGLLLKEYPDATLTVVGQGRDRKWLRKVAERLGVGHAVDWKDWTPHEEVLGMYRVHTALLFPSLHDSGGTVLMESLSQGLPVICLDCGGPGAMLPQLCGFKVKVEGKSQAEVIRGLTCAMRQLFEDSSLRAEMSSMALRAARENTWGQIVSRTYTQVRETFNYSKPETARKTGAPPHGAI
jgi:glycosyltransferase involved in cell wall biosynthesis